MDHQYLRELYISLHGQKIVMNAMGIQIDNGMGGKIELTGPQVSVNSGALEVI